MTGTIVSSGSWRSKGQRGQSSLEFALVLPLLLLVILVLAQLGILLFSHLILVQAARDGVREGVVTNDNGAIIEKVRNSAALLDQSRVKITISPASSQSRGIGDSLTVSVQYQVSTVFPGLDRILPSFFTIRSSTSMRMEKE
jgi:Flp pilus assembly protein TadG